MIVREIEEELFRLRDEGYRDFQGKLLPTVAPERMIGVRTPALCRPCPMRISTRPSSMPSSFRR